MAKLDLLQGTLDLLILKTLALGPQHGWGISQRIQQISDNVLRVNQGSLYPALQRLETAGWIDSEWGASDNNRQAKFYQLTRRASGSCSDETAQWERMTGAVAKILADRGRDAMWKRLIGADGVGGELDRGLNAEVRFHIEMETEKNIAARHEPATKRASRR